MSSGIVVENLVKRHGALTALDRVSFEVKPGELTVLLGPSGCGKSTLLRLIAGLDLPSDGIIKLGGRDMTYADPADRQVAMVFQSYGLFPHLTVANNILFGLQIRNVPKAERDARLKRASEILGLDGLLDRRPSQLSGGQQQRVALARAVVADRPICLMDEPLSNLDAQLRNSVRREIAELQRRLGLTMVYVTHDQIEAMTLADRIVLLRGGRVMQEGSPRELYERPANRFTASFIGAPPMNLLRFEKGQADDAIAAFWPKAAAALAARGKIEIGVRPEHLRLAADRGVPARIVSGEYVGGASMLALDIFGQTALAHLPEPAPDWKPGDEIHIQSPQGAEHLFDAESGQRID